MVHNSSIQCFPFRGNQEIESCVCMVPGPSEDARAALVYLSSCENGFVVSQVQGVFATALSVDRLIDVRRQEFVFLPSMHLNCTAPSSRASRQPTPSMCCSRAHLHSAGVESTSRTPSGRRSRVGYPSPLRPRHWDPGVCGERDEADLGGGGGGGGHPLARPSARCRCKVKRRRPPERWPRPAAASVACPPFPRRLSCPIAKRPARPTVTARVPLFHPQRLESPTTTACHAPPSPSLTTRWCFPPSQRLPPGGCR